MPQLTCAQQSAALPNPLFSNTQLEDVKLRGNLVSVLSSLAVGYDVPIGMETAMNGVRDGSRIRINFKKGTLQELLTQVFSDQKQYSWEIKDGVVRVFPKQDYQDPIVQRFLAVELANVSIKEKTCTWCLEQILVKTPEIRQLFNDYGLTSASFAFSGFYIPQLGRNFTLDASNITVQSLLNRIVKDSPTAKFWVLSRDSSEHSIALSLSARHEDTPRGQHFDMSILDDDDDPE
jgi:hypothetical protein